MWKSNVYFLHDTRIYKELIVNSWKGILWSFIPVLCLLPTYYKCLRAHLLLTKKNTSNWTILWLPILFIWLPLINPPPPKEMKLYYNVSTIFAFKCECFLFVFIWFFFLVTLTFVLWCFWRYTESWFVHHLFFTLSVLPFFLFGKHHTAYYPFDHLGFVLFLRFVSFNLTFWFVCAQDLQYKYGKVNRCIVVNGEKICLLTFVLYHNRLLSRKREKRA